MKSLSAVFDLGGDLYPLLNEFLECRARTLSLCESLETEDMVVQPLVEVSPVKWHLGHTTWFFERFVLADHLPGYQMIEPAHNFIFNSYYANVGPSLPRAERGTLSRPTVNEVINYRHRVDETLVHHFHKLDLAKMGFIFKAGIEHEKQHQELLLMDLKYILSRNHPPVGLFEELLDLAPTSKGQMIPFKKGLYQIGAEGTFFFFDCEAPRHAVHLNDFALSDHLVTNGEFLEFIEDGGYKDSLLWLAAGWDWVQSRGIRSPLYWKKESDGWYEYTLHGLFPINPHFPVCHVSYYEAQAFARWAGYRLPLEAELEVFLEEKKAAGDHDRVTGFATSQFHPTKPQAVAGQVWCWTQSPYIAYPGFSEFAGPLREYNGKFMCNQLVLRGGSVATPPEHFRSSYRNFFLPEQRWMFSGIRLAKDL